MNLFDLSHQYQAALDAAIDPDTGEIRAEDAFAALDSLGDALEAKAINVAAYIRNLEAEAAAVKSAAKDMQARADRLSGHADDLRQHLASSLQVAGLTEVKDPRFVIKVRHNPPSVHVLDQQAIPAAYLRYPEPPAPQPDKTAIKAAIQAGESVPGVQLVRTTKVEIK